MSSSHRPVRSRSSTLTRRRFLRGAAAVAGAATIAPRHVLGGPGHMPPSETLQVGVVGTGGRGKNVIRGLLRYDDVRIATIADVTEHADYSRFYYRGESGRLPVRDLVRKHYEAKGVTNPCPDYVDFRGLLEKEKGIDAVVVATPDHAHAVVSLAAIRLGKHVYCEKPLTRCIEETRRVTEAARRAGVATQMGNQGNSGEGIRQMCEWIWSGAIGDVREVHAWSQTGGWAWPLEGRPEETPPVPKGLDWDRWLGPVEERPYHPIYTPYNWRGWWAFGTGSIGDMGCHNIDPAMAALRLRYPDTVEACSTRLNDETTPVGVIVRFTFPARGKMPPVHLTWYDGGLYPPRPDELEPGEAFDRNGILFVGERGKLLSGGWSRGPRLLPRSRMESFREPEKTLPRVAAHDRAWVDACKGGPAASSNFDYAGPLTELVLLGNVALRSGEKLEWNGEAMRATNSTKAEQYVKATYRKGWTL